MKNKLVVPFLSKAVNISMILLMIVTLMNTRAVRVVQAAYNPSFSARLTENQVHGYEWNLGDSVTLTIDDPDNGVSNDFTDTQTVVVADWDPTMTFVLFDLGSGGFLAVTVATWRSAVGDAAGRHAAHWYPGFGGHDGHHGFGLAPSLGGDAFGWHG